MAFTLPTMACPRVSIGTLPEDLAADDRFVRSLIRRFVTDPHLVDDLAQDTWEAALRHSAAGGFFERAWLGTVAQNFVFQSLRGKARRVAREAYVARSEEVEPAADSELDPDLRRRVLSAVRALDEPYRSAVQLRFFEDLPPTLIAERLGVPAETIRTRIKRGLGRVHAHMRRSR